MPDYRIRLGAKGRAVIPAPLRAELGLADGDDLVARVEDHRLVLETPDMIMRRLRAEARAAGGGGGVVDTLLEERREQLRVEEERGQSELGPIRGAG